MPRKEAVYWGAIKHCHPVDWLTYSWFPAKSQHTSKRRHRFHRGFVSSPLTVLLVQMKRRGGSVECQQVFWRPSSKSQRHQQGCTGPAQWQSWPARERQTRCWVARGPCTCGTSFPRHRKQTCTGLQDRVWSHWLCWKSARGQERLNNSVVH